MLYGHSRVPNIAWGISTNGTAVSFATSASLMNDGRPGSVCRFLWPVHSTPASAWVQIEGTWAQPSATRVIGLINFTMLQGTVVEISFRRFGSSLWDSPIGTAYVERRADGTKVCYASLPDLGRVYSGVRFKILAMNPILGDASIFAGTPVDIGEVFIGELGDLPVDRNWSVTWEDSTNVRDSELVQPWPRRGTPRRVLTFTPSQKGFGIDAVYGARQGIGTDVPLSALEKVYSKIMLGAQTVWFPRVDQSGFALMSRSAIFGAAAKLGGYRHIGGNLFSADAVTVKEAPIPL